MFKKIDKKDIVKEVMKAVGDSKKEIIATMLLTEEISVPLPISYHEILKKKVENGVMIKRLGFGTREDYNEMKKRLFMKSKRYHFRYISQVSQYQRLLVIDKNILFFGIDGSFFRSSYKPMVNAFLVYFKELFKIGKL